MKHLICFLVGLMVLFIMPSCRGKKHAKNYNELVDESASYFIKQGVEASQTEIKASKIAEVNSKNPRVLFFAKMMIADHIATDDELKKIAINNRIGGGDSISTAHQKIIANITTLTGNTFDKAYIQMMVTAHQNAVKLFTTATDDRNEDIQKFARETLPTLKTHLDSANAISAILK